MEECAERLSTANSLALLTDVKETLTGNVLEHMEEEKEKEKGAAGEEEEEGS